ncbi:hypothetical protein T4B_4355 [Trichinella pseudospiralis]|uniref:MULE transposase domain-containing protein n=1 Tax=Trichinella pseudospiralis TaxID=6337 RepID=A0A0V1IB04_TRIPS|nr:hypothetical protein T4B_7864 [Trichinella pseudospiralis]KRZ19712.1 hypothetical protein T4B_4355 [Trichinella pseudospiralis]
MGQIIVEALIHEGRVYRLKTHKLYHVGRKGMQEFNPYYSRNDCLPDSDALYEKEKKNTLEGQEAEEMKFVLQIYSDEASIACFNLETAVYRRLVKIFPALPAIRQELTFLHTGKILLFNLITLWSVVATLKSFRNGISSCSLFMFLLLAEIFVRKDLPTYHEIFKETALWPQTIICDFETALIPAVQGSFPCVYIQGCYFYLCQAVVRKVTILGMRTRNILEVARRKTVKMPLAAMKNRKCLLSFYELLQLLVDEWDSVETLNQQMTSGRVTADDLQINNKYERITASTAE